MFTGGGREDDPVVVLVLAYLIVLLLLQVSWGVCGCKAMLAGTFVNRSVFFVVSLAYVGRIHAP